jgi:hypothetical protein
VQSDDINAVKQQLAAAGIEAEQQFDGVVVKRFGAQGNASSIYIRDPGGLGVLEDLDGDNSSSALGSLASAQNRTVFSIPVGYCKPQTS